MMTLTIHRTTHQVMTMVKTTQNQSSSQFCVNILLSIIYVRYLNCSNNHPLIMYRYHFDSLAQDNSSDLATIKSISLPEDLNQFTEPPPILSNQPTDPTIVKTRRTPVPVKCYGLQSVSKFNASESESHEVHIWLGLWRLRGIGNDGRGTDLILTFNLPNLPSSSHYAHFQQSVEFTNIIFQQAACSLQIVDWSLFA
ncbi:hypothetical protein Pst134EA_005305 [Puccinia striiformis f. sp. tritici]|uniref:hypothetical protein n=1 Tax=Puccinia striiformis f. sp. tritici TaxID=168172 RepID=UPI0020079082|nr:hypothetical protein Pst134EA_005305 [Puccinia striiformis f. sp. tritici]KAH9471405.1 hypothetical protein Pst134EA_005305 [Puccinia striiformis f. sp. tritici]